MRAEEFSERRDRIEGWDVKVTLYRIDQRYHCRVDNVSPGATVSRGDGKTREEAEKTAVDKAKERLGKTKTRQN